MPDKYNSFSALAKSETLGRDFLVRRLVRPGAPVVIAPHGGGIEPGTSELAEAIAGDDFSFYAFEGIKAAGNGDLHITSTRFDEPQCLALVRVSPQVIAIHGEESESQAVFLGGLDAETLALLRQALTVSGFRVEIHDNPALQGRNTTNICNRGENARGIQLELSKGLRRSFFGSLSTGQGRQSKKEPFARFVAAARRGCRSTVGGRIEETQ
jgi:phage replication-related protein YjqB (UPF0714/DUF867 family)